MTSLASTDWRQCNFTIGICNRVCDATETRWNNWVYVTKWVACGWSLCRIGMPRRVPDFNLIKFFQPLITVLSQIGNVATFWNKVKQVWGKSVGRKRAYIIKPAPQCISHWLTHPTNMGGAVSSTCYNQESGLFPCLYPSHPDLRDENARLRTFGPNWPHHHPNLSPSEMSKAGFFWLVQGDWVKCYYCDSGLSRWKTDDDVFVEHAKWFPHCEYLLQQKIFAFVFETTFRLINFYRPLSRKLGQPVPAGLLLRKWVSFRGKIALNFALIWRYSLMFAEWNIWNTYSPITVEVQYLFWTWKKCWLFTLFSCLCLLALCHAM